MNRSVNQSSESGSRRRALLALWSGLLFLIPTPAPAQHPAPGAQQPPTASPTTAYGADAFVPGRPLGVTLEGQYTPMSENLRVFGSFRFSESCVFDPDRDLIVAINRGMSRTEIENDGYVSLIHPDGSVHTTKWIGETRDGLWLDDPLGSAVLGRVLHVVDVNMVRKFDLDTGSPLGAFEVDEATGLNGIAVAQDGTIYASNTGGQPRIYRISADGESSVFVDGAPLEGPNGVAMDPAGNIVVVNVQSTAVLTFSPAGELLHTEHTVQPGNDGIVIVSDGTKYVSSVREGGISRIRPGQTAELIAWGIPSAASMCHDPVRRQLVIPMNNQNALAFLPLED